MPACAECIYVGDQQGGSMTCHRYPQPYRVARSYWCGEYKPRTEDKPVEPKRRLRASLAVTEPPTVVRRAADNGD